MYKLGVLYHIIRAFMWYNQWYCMIKLVYLKKLGYCAIKSIYVKSYQLCVNKIDSLHIFVQCYYMMIIIWGFIKDSPKTLG